MALTKFTEKLISDSFKTSISGSDNTESASFSSRVTLVEGGTTSKTLVSGSAQLADDISGSLGDNADVIRSLVDKYEYDNANSKYLIVVEHDLAVLDYMSDYIQSLYGNGYLHRGLCSLPQHTSEQFGHARV